MIRQATPNDLEILIDITRRAYGSATMTKENLERNLNIQPDGFFLGYLENQPVGIVCAFDYGSFASIGTLGVIPEAQNHGMGRKLMEQVELWAKQKNILSLILDATPEGARLYETMGYTDVDHNYKMVLKAFSTTPQPLNIRPFMTEDLPAILELDKTIFAANRQKVLEVFLNQYSNRTIISYEQQNLINGFLVAQPSTIGPWITLSEDNAKNLLHAALRLEYNGLPRVLIPDENKVGLELLQNYGFEVSKTLRHMVKGDIPKQHREHIYGQTSFSLG